MANYAGNVGSMAATGAGAGAFGGPIGAGIGAGAGALVGLIKSIADQNNETKDRQMQSITDRYSPWTKMRGVAPDHTNTIGNVAAMLSQGAEQGQKIDSRMNNNTQSQASAAKYDTGPSAQEMANNAVAASQPKSGVDSSWNEGTPNVDPNWEVGSPNVDPDLYESGLKKIIELYTSNNRNRKMSGLA